MKNLGYIKIYNNKNFNNNIIRKEINPKVNFSKSHMKLNSSNVNNNPNNLNFKKININPINVQHDNNFIKEQSKKIHQINTYTNLLSLTNRGENSQNEVQPNQRKNISLNKIQSEIKMIEIKLRSDIIKNKIKKLNDISNDSKSNIYQIRKPQSKYSYSDRDYNNRTNNYKKISNNSVINKNYLIGQREKEGIQYTNRKQNLNYNNKKESVKHLVRKKIIDLTGDNQIEIFKNKTALTINNNNNYNNKINKIYINNSKQNYNYNYNFKFNKNALKEKYENIKRNKDILQRNKKLNFISIKKGLNNSSKSLQNFLIKSPSYEVKNSFNNEYQKYNNYNFSHRNFNINNNINLKNNKIKYINDNYNTQNRFDEISMNNNTEKTRNEYISDYLPEGTFDQYFIGNFYNKNINSTLYNTIENKSNLNIKEIKVKKQFKIDKSKFNNLLINNSNPNDIQLKKSFDFQKEKNKKIQININNRIINADNFSFNPIKVNFHKQMDLSNDSEYKKNKINKNINKYHSFNIKNELMKKDLNNIIINNHQIQNNNINIENYIIKYNDDKQKNINNIINDNIFNSIEKKNINNDNKNINSPDNKNEIIKKKEKQINNKITLPLIMPIKLEKKKDILNESMEFSKEENDEKEIRKDGKKVSFDDKKIIIEYNQYDYVKKSFIFSNKDSKKIKHNYLSTKDHINNLKKNNNKKSILLVSLNNNNKEKKSLNSDLALIKLNELISEIGNESEINTPINVVNENTNEKNNSKEYKDNNSNNSNLYIKKNVKYIKKNQDYNKKGLNYKVLSKSEIKLLKKKKKFSFYKFKNNTQHFFTDELCNNIIKSFDFDDNNLLRLNKKSFSRNNSDMKKKLNNSFNGDFKYKKYI